MGAPAGPDLTARPHRAPAPPRVFRIDGPSASPARGTRSPRSAWSAGTAVTAIRCAIPTWVGAAGKSHLEGAPGARRSPGTRLRHGRGDVQVSVWNYPGAATDQATAVVGADYRPDHEADHVGRNPRPQRWTRRVRSDTQFESTWGDGAETEPPYARRPHHLQPAHTVLSPAAADEEGRSGADELCTDLMSQFGL
jgi:hypothetical protein